MNRTSRCDLIISLIDECLAEYEASTQSLGSDGADERVDDASTSC